MAFLLMSDRLIINCLSLARKPESQKAPTKTPEEVVALESVVIVPTHRDEQ